MSTQITIQVLADNSVVSSGGMAEHGWALWVDSGSECMFFDTGQSHLLIDNSRILGIDIDAVDAVVLSHGHYDHTGGLADILFQAEGDVRVCLHPDALAEKYGCSGNKAREIGMTERSRNALSGPHCHLVTSRESIEPIVGVRTTGEIPRIHSEEETSGSFWLDSDCREKDFFLDDQAVFIPTKKGTIVLLGCAHAGVINTLDHILNLTDGDKIRAIVGGMHLHSASDERIAWTLDALKKFDMDAIYPAHCTGAQAVSALWSEFPGRCFTCGVGTKLSF